MPSSVNLLQFANVALDQVDALFQLADKLLRVVSRRAGTITIGVLRGRCPKEGGVAPYGSDRRLLPSHPEFEFTDLCHASIVAERELTNGQLQCNAPDTGNSDLSKDGKLKPLGFPLVRQQGFEVADRLIRKGCLLFMFQRRLCSRNLAAVAKGVQVSGPIPDHLLKVIVSEKPVRVQQIKRLIRRASSKFVHVVTYDLILPVSEWRDA